MNLRPAMLFRALAVMVLAGFTCLPARPAAAAPRSPITFYDGTLSRTDLDDYTLLIGVNKTKAYGLAYTDDSHPSHLGFLRLVGTLSGKSLSMTALAFTGLDKETPVGSFRGTLKSNGKLKGTFSIRGGRNGTFSTDRVHPDTADIEELIGSYVVSAGSVDVHLSLNDDQTFDIYAVYQGIRVAKIKGYWVAQDSPFQDGSKYLWLQPTSIGESNAIFDLNIKPKVPLEFRYEFNDGLLTLFNAKTDHEYITLEVD